MRDKIQPHLKEDCDERSVTCELCGIKFKNKNHNKHQDECIERFISCESCDLEIKRKNSDSHKCLKDTNKEINLLKRQHF
jgi:hypothetical protein